MPAPKNPNTKAASDARRQGEKPKVRVNVMLDPDLLAALDTLEGSRSGNIEKAVKKLLKQ
jgi:hypothetical protein